MLGIGVSFRGGEVDCSRTPQIYGRQEQGVMVIQHSKELFVFVFVETGSHCEPTEIHPPHPSEC